MKYTKIVLIGIILYVLAGCTTALEMSPPSSLDMKGINKHPYVVGLYISKELRETVYLKQTSPLDKISYPIGEQTTAFFKNNLPYVFKEVIFVESKNPPQDVKLILEPSIVKFNSVIPSPAYNPYTAEIIYRIDVYNRNGEKIFTQTAKGEAQTSKGLLSGFAAQSLAAEAAQKAMENAMKQIIEGLAEAEELKKL